MLLATHNDNDGCETNSETPAPRFVVSCQQWVYLRRKWFQVKSTPQLHENLSKWLKEQQHQYQQYQQQQEEH